MSKSIQHVKLQPSLLAQMEINNQRILAQITLMNDNPTAYTGEVLKHALCVIAWHSDEQKGLIDTLQGHIKRLNKLIDQADVILSERNEIDIEPFSVCQDALLNTGLGGDNE